MSSSGECRRLRPLVPLLAGADLDLAEARRVWRHLAACPACRDRHARLLAARGALESLRPPAHGGEAFFEALQADVLAAVGAPARARFRWRPWLAAACVVGLSLAATGWLRDSRAPGEALLGRSPLPAVPASPVARWPVDDPSRLLPLAYPQGLEAQRRLQLLFDRLPAAEAPLEPVVDDPPR